MKRLMTLALPAVLLAGCGAEESELRAWMEEIRRTTQPVRETIAEPKSFEPFRYDAVGQIDPFSAIKMSVALDKLVERDRSSLAPDLNRRREPLENYPLDAIKMVGHLANGKQSYALLQVDNLVFQARVGNYAGQNFGVITKVNEAEIKLKELVQDAAGDWKERETSLQIQEGTRK